MCGGSSRIPAASTGRAPQEMVCTGEREHESFQSRFQKLGHYFPSTEMGSRQRPTGLEWGVLKRAEPGAQLEALIQILGWSLKGHKDQIN